MKSIRPKVILKALLFSLLAFSLVLAVIWFNYYSPAKVQDEAQAVSAIDFCQDQYNKFMWSQEWIPPESQSANYSIYRYNYGSCPYKNDAGREKFLTYGYKDGSLTAAGNLGVIGGKVYLNKQLADLSLKSYVFDGYASSSAYYKIADSSTIFSDPACLDPAVYGKYATATIFDKIASSTIFINQGNSTIFDQCAKQAEFDQYADSTIYDIYAAPGSTLAAVSHRGLTITAAGKELLAIYGTRQKNFLNIKFNLPAQAKTVAASEIFSKVNDSDTRWADNVGPYVGHCQDKKSESGAPVCTAGNCRGACPAIDCQALKPSTCLGQWTWDESCSYYAPEMDQYEFVKTGEERYECGSWHYTCYRDEKGVDNFACPGLNEASCNSCYKYVSEICVRNIGYNVCVSSKCVKREPDCRVGRAIVGRPDYKRAVFNLEGGGSLRVDFSYEDPTKNSDLERLINKISRGDYNPYNDDKISYRQFDSGLSSLISSAGVVSENLNDYLGRNILSASLSE